MQAEFPRSGMHRGDSKNVGRRKILELNWLKCPKIVPKNPEIWSRKGMIKNFILEFIY